MKVNFIIGLNVVIGFTCLLLAVHKHQNVAAKILIEELGVRSVSAINDTGINCAHVAASAGKSTYCVLL